MSITSRPALTGDRCQCSACGLLFKSTSAFDHHRTGNYAAGRHCLTVDELRAMGWAANDAGFWRKALTDEQRSKLFSTRPTITKEDHHDHHV